MADGALTAIETPSRPAPVAAADRYAMMDVVRGFALLGILGPNIVAFAWPQEAMTDPDVMGGGAGNETGHAIVSVFFLGKMMALFSMLFGAGVVIFDRKTDRSGEGRRPRLSDGAGLWYRRIAWLLVFGLLHAFGLWYGDILVWYAITALAAIWWVRRFGPWLQIGLGIGLHALGTALIVGFSAFGVWAVTSGKITEAELMGGSGEIAGSGYLGGYGDAFMERLGTLPFMYVLGVFFLPGVTGLMMLGMGLTKLGVLTGERSTRFYAVLAAAGLIGGFGITLGAFFGLRAAMPDFGNFIWQSCSQFIGIPISLGFMGLLGVLVTAGALRPVTALLANVGRMALSNYFAQTIIATTMFYGYGLGLFGKVDYPALWGVVAGIWVFNLVFSALWLRWFRYGPFEWLWRSLTYWRVEPIRRPVSA